MSQRPMWKSLGLSTYKSFFPEDVHLKEIHTSSELNIMESYLFRGKLTYHNALLEQGTATKMLQLEERERADSCFTSAYIV